MNKQDALLTIATSAVDAVAAVLYEIAPGQIVADEATVVVGRDPLDGLRMPAITASVSVIDGAQGGTFFAMPLSAASKLAAAMAEGEGEAPEGDVEELTDSELSAVTEAIGRMMAAATQATGSVLGQTVEIDEPSITTVRTRAELKVSFQGATGATVAELSLFGEQCRLIQIIPTIFTMRATQALAASSAPDFDDDSAEAVREALREVPLRVWAELGRAGLRSADAAALADGAIVELDRAADDPIDVYVNGSRIATGRLIAVEEDEWAVRLEHVFPMAHTPPRV